MNEFLEIIPRLMLMVSIAGLFLAVVIRAWSVSDG